MNADSQVLLEIAVQAARDSGALLIERFAAGREPAVASKSSPTDLVSEADLASQRAIRKLLSEQRPQDGFLGEEGGDETGSSGLRWVVDPLDGTINFLFGIPQWCVSVAVKDEHGALAGAVYDPNRDELFTATRDGQPLCNGKPIKASGAGDLQLAMVATGFAYQAEVRAVQAQVLAKLIPQVRDVRRFGSAALDLAWTAAGRYDAFYERGVKEWDVAAGALICEAAGLQTAPLPAEANIPDGIAVAAPELLAKLAPLIGATLPEPQS